MADNSQRKTPIKYVPAIPDPTPNPVDMVACIRALKIAVEFLSGQSAGGIGRVLTIDDVVQGTDVYQFVTNAIVPVATGEASEIIDETVVELRAALVTAQDEVQELLLNGEGSWADADEALTIRIDEQEVAIGENTAAITLEQVTRADADSAISAQIDTVSATTATNAAAITTEQIARTDADSALAAQVTSVTAVAGRQRIFVQSTPPASPGPTADAMWIDTAHSNSIKVWSGSAWVPRDNTTIAANVAAITTEQIARATADSSLSAQINTVVATAAANTAAITTESVARASADTTLSGQITTATALGNMGSATGKIQLIATAATATGVLSEFIAQVYVEGAGVFSNAGMRLRAMATGASEAVFDVTNFKIRQIANNTDVYPFEIVGGTTIIREAVIGNATIATAKIKDLAVETLKIGDNAVTVPAVQTLTTVLTNGTFINASTVSLSVTGVAGSPITILATWGANIGYSATVNNTYILYIDGSQVAIANGSAIDAFNTLIGTTTITATGSAQTVVARVDCVVPSTTSIGSRTLFLQAVKR